MDREGIWAVGRLLRALHDATESFRPPPGAIWKAWFFHSTAAEAIIGHGDTVPWNIVARDGLPVAFIDWEYAGPIDREDELAATGWLNAQLHDDDIAERNNLPSASTRAAQLRRFLDGYELPAAQRAGFVTHMIEYAIRDCAKEAIAPITSLPADPAPITPRIDRPRAGVGAGLARPLGRLDARPPPAARTRHRTMTSQQTACRRTSETTSLLLQTG